MIHDNASRELPDDEEDDGPILLHGVCLPQANESAPPPSPPDEELPETLTLRPYDDDVPGRDFQPRLLRYGEAA